MRATLARVGERAVSSVTEVALMVAITPVLAAIVVPPMLASSDDLRGSGAPEASFGAYYSPDAESVRSTDGFEATNLDVADRIHLHYHGNTDVELGNLVVYVGGERVGDLDTMVGGSRLVSGGSLVLSEAPDSNRYLERGEALEVVWRPPVGDSVFVFRAPIPSGEA